MPFYGGGPFTVGMTTISKQLVFGPHNFPAGAAVVVATESEKPDEEAEEEVSSD